MTASLYPQTMLSTPFLKETNFLMIRSTYCFQQEEINVCNHIRQHSVLRCINRKAPASFHNILAQPKAHGTEGSTLFKGVVWVEALTHETHYEDGRDPYIFLVLGQ